MPGTTTRLFASSASGAITTLALTIDAQDLPSLKRISVINDSKLRPSFLLKHPLNKTLYCSHEKRETSSSIGAYSISSAGGLQLIERHDTLGGSCHQEFYNDGKALAIAEYDGSGVSTWKMASTGPDLIRQEASHPHQIVVDPSGQYLCVVDLGADVIRIFKIDNNDSTLIEQDFVTVPPGSGPRHGVFSLRDGKTFFYLVSELSSTLITFSVVYEANTLSMKQLSLQSIYGSDPVPKGAYACDVLVSPDNNFLLTCSRLDYKLQIDSFSGDNGTEIPSDTMQVWAIDPTTGVPQFQQLSPSWGVNPRHFSFNRKGNMVAVALVGDHRVVIIQRDMMDGTLGKVLTHVEGISEAMCVIWDE
ncbi:extracellular aldonolactonase [Botrytis cinerea]